MNYDQTYRWWRCGSRRFLRTSRLDLNPSKYAREKRSFAECERFLLDSLCMGVTTTTRQMIQYELALLYLQHGKEAQADVYLHRLGIRHRLASIFFTTQMSSLSSSPPPPSSSSSSSSSTFCISSKEDISVHRFHANKHVASFDDILPISLLTPLMKAFDPIDSSFWSSHGYPSENFFSYNCNIKHPSAQENNLINQVACYLLPFIDQQFPHKRLRKNVHSIEWWAHCRGKTDGHQLHYDLDEISLGKQGDNLLNLQNIHPLISCVLYLQSGSSFPTIVFDETLAEDSKKAKKAYICQPASNRGLFFDGKLLHGVVPQWKPENSETSRITLMLGFWGESVNTSEATSSSVLLKPNMMMPDVSSSEFAWVHLLKPSSSQGLKDSTERERRKPSDHAILEIRGKVWTSIESPIQEVVKLNSSDEFQKLRAADSCVVERMGSRRKRRKSMMSEMTDKQEQIQVNYTGKWFLRSEDEIRDEVVNYRRPAENYSGYSGYSQAADAHDHTSASDVLSFVSKAELERMRSLH